jgi:hypothetical protein
MKDILLTIYIGMKQYIGMIYYFIGLYICSSAWYPEILPKDILPKDVLPNGRFAERTFVPN